MKKWIWSLGIALLAGGMVTQVWALPPGRISPFWESEKVVEKLGLSNEQLEELAEVEYQFEKANIELESQIKIARLTLERLLSREKLAKNKLAELVNELSRARMKQTEILLEKKIKVRSILSLEQWKECEKGRRRLGRRLREARGAKGGRSHPPRSGMERAKEMEGEREAPPIPADEED